MPRLTPKQLQEARIRSGKLGGRPANPTAAEARTAALERLVPKAIRVLEDHLDSGRPDAWRSACKILEHSWGRPPEPLIDVVAPVEIDPAALEHLSTAELQAIVRRGRERPLPSANDASSTDVRDISVTADAEVLAIMQTS
jgi:hypothetical protein